MAYEYEIVILQGGVETAGYYRGTLEEMRFWLNAKEKSHKANGYAILRNGDSMTAWKLKSSGGTKTRRIFIRKTP